MPTPDARGAVQSCERDWAGKNGAQAWNACAIAFDAAVQRQRFDDALHYAALGCERYQGSHYCRLVASLPEAMARQGVAVPERFAAEVVRLADLVCLSGARFYNIIGKDDTGITCDYYARQFVRTSRYRERHGEPPDLLASHLAALERPQLALRLYEVACSYWGYAPSCDSAALLADRVEKVPATQHGVSALLNKLEIKIESLRAVDAADASHGRSLAAYAQGDTGARSASLERTEAAALQAPDR